MIDAIHVSIFIETRVLFFPSFFYNRKSNFQREYTLIQIKSIFSQRFLVGEMKWEIFIRHLRDTTKEIFKIN